MDTITFGRIYDIIWSLFAISGGLILLFKRDWFISANSKAFLHLYKKTKFSLFKRQSEDVKKLYMYYLVPGLGIVFIVAGILLLLGMIR